MQILPKIKAMGKALWLEKQKVLVVADFHIGYESFLSSKGIFVPRGQLKETFKELHGLMEKVRPKTIVIAGDLKHEFGKISEQEWRDSLALIDFLSGKCKNIVLIRGNHDTILGPIAKKRNLQIKDFFCLDNICILHGHKILLDKAVHDAKILIIAHEHPAISLKEGPKSEIYKCFLLGKWKRKKLIVMPSFLPIIEGSDISKEKLLSPFLYDISNFQVFVLGKDKVYKFGKLRDL